MSNYIVSDTSLSSIADAIREKTGSSEQLVFPNGFISEIENIAGGITVTETEDTHGGTVKNIVAVDLSEDTVDAEHLATGYTAHDKDGNAVVGSATIGGYSVDEIASASSITGDLVFTNNISKYAFYGRTGITGVSGNISTIGEYAFYGCTGLTSINFPNLTSIGGYCFKNCTGLPQTLNLVGKLKRLTGRLFQGCTSLVTFVGAFTEGWSSAKGYTFDGCTSLTTLDISVNNFNSTSIAIYVFQGCANLSTIILRNTGMCSLANLNAFGGTPFASGGSGGTIYIPKVLYDELGTGSSLDYKAATNWSTIDGYGTITWAKIEDSQYENYYADGTLIQSN